LPRLPLYFLAPALLTAWIPGRAQSRPVTTQASSATVRAVRIFPEKEGPALEIISTRPLTPAIQKIEDPPRLVIDLPGVNLALARRRIAFRNAQIRGIRLNQFQTTPAVARVVVDLLEPISYTWDATGNRLMIRLHTEEEEPPAPPKPQWTTASTTGPQPAYLSVSSRTSGTMMPAGSRLAAGSSVSAGSNTTVLHLARGGEVRVCPGTTVSVTPSQNNRQLMLGMSTGALEEHYSLGATADSLVTPDFRILLAGPGEFHYAFRVDSRGNTCVHALPGNTASVLVSELLGDGTYQVKPTEQVVFRAGRVGLLETALPADCGCPPAAVPVMLASSSPAPVIRDADAQGPIHLAQAGDKNSGLGSRSDYGLSQEAWAANSPETAPLPASRPNEVHVQVDAPFVFRAAELAPAPAPGVAGLPLADSRGPATLPATALPPPKDEHRSLLRKLKGFLAAMFS
jgi:hypothetical protein